MSKLLINEPPLLVLPSLATLIGLNEAITLQQIHYWLDPRVNKNFKENKFWVYNSYEDWQKQFPFWSVRTIRRNIQSLEEKELLISKNFSSNSFDKTKWYTINYEALDNYTSDETRSGQIVHIESDNLDYSICSNQENSNRPIRPKEIDKLATSFKETKNTTKNSTENYISEISNIKFQHPSNLFSKAETRESKMLEIWNRIVENHFGREIKITTKRKIMLNDRLEKFFSNSLDSWQKFCQYILESKFLMGEIKDFRVSLDWVLKEEYMVKVLEGTYHRETNTPGIKKNISIKGEQDELYKEIENSIQNLNTPNFWKEVLLEVLKKMGSATYNSWIRRNEFHDFKDGVIQIRSFSTFAANYINQNFASLIVKICIEKISGFKELKFFYE